MKNPLKEKIQKGKPVVGAFVGLGHPDVTETLSRAGFDWLLIDGEHAPNDLRSTLAQLQAVAPYPAHPIVRPVRNDTAIIKQLLDIGAQTLLVPMIENAIEARAAVAATRYPPHGVRGVGSALARASRWNGSPDYLHHAADELCVLVQVETTGALAQLDEIANVEGVDGVFFGPADLSASMGLLGQPGAPQVREAICEGIRTVRAQGKGAGVLAADPAIANEYLGAGATFVAVGSDVSLLARSASELAAKFRQPAPRG